MKRSPMQRGTKPMKRGKGFQQTKDGLQGKQRAGTKVTRTGKAKRARLPSRKSLVKKIDSVVFKIICLMFPACVECSSVDRPTTGHVLSRRSYATRWDFRNIFRQCWPCNYKAAMTAAASYHLWYVKRFGVEAFDELYQDWTKGRKYTRLELINLLAEFQEKLKGYSGEGDETR